MICFFQCFAAVAKTNSLRVVARDGEDAIMFRIRKLSMLATCIHNVPFESVLLLIRFGEYLFVCSDWRQIAEFNTCFRNKTCTFMSARLHKNGKSLTPTSALLSRMTFPLRTARKPPCKSSQLLNVFSAPVS